MTTTTELLTDAFDRIRQEVHRVLDGRTPQELAARVGANSNTIGWLIWHLTRIQDDHIADVADVDQVWTSDGWHDRFDLPFDASDTGYGHTSADVAAVRDIDAADLLGYFDAVHQQTLDYLEGLTANDLDRVVDERWDPPVTLSVRLVSVISDDLQHVGQAAFIHGLL